MTAWACAGREPNNGANTAMINKLRKIDERRIRIHLINITILIDGRPERASL